RGGKNISRLITTRNLNLLDDTEAKLVSVYQMNNQEALNLLLAEIDYQELAHFEAILEDFGHYPLLLSLANAVIRKRISLGDSVLGAVEWINHTIKSFGYSAFDYLELGSHNQAIAHTIETSLEFLDADSKEKFSTLG